MPRQFSILFLACALAILAGWQAIGTETAAQTPSVVATPLAVYPDSDTSFNPRVPCIAPVDREGGKCMDAEAAFQYALAPYVKFAGGGELVAEVRDNGRREAKDIVTLSDGGESLILRVGKALDGDLPALVLVKGGKTAASAALAKPLPRQWSKVDIKWDASSATLVAEDGETAKLTFPDHFVPKNAGLQTAQVTDLKIAGQGTFALDWKNGYAAQVVPAADSNETEARFFGFDTYVISRNPAKRDCPMVQVMNGGSEARTVKFDFELAGEESQSHQQWSQAIEVPARSSVMAALNFPAALASDVYHLAVHSASFQPALTEAKHFLFVEDRGEPAGPAKFGLHDSARNLFGAWPDALPVSLSTNYISWGMVVGPAWLKDPGMNADTPPDEWNWNRRVDWAVGQGLTTYVSLGSTPFYDWARARNYPPANMKKQGWGMTGGFPRLDLYRKFVREVATRYKGKVHYYEVENEPMAGAGITPQDYVEIARAVSEEVHAVDPSAKVYGICGTGDFVPWMSKVFELGGAKVMDGVSVHTYVTPNMPEKANLPGKLAEVDKLIAGSGRPMPMLNSETGTYIALREEVDHPISRERLDELIKSGTPNLSVKAGWPFHAVDERSGGASVVRNAIYNFLAKAQYFTFFGYNPAWPPAGWATGASLFSGEHNVDDACWAMISATKNGERTPSLFSLAVGVLTEQMKGADQLQGQAVDNEGLLGGVFPKANGGEVAILWSPLGKRSALLAASDPEIEVVSMLGHKTMLTAAGGAANGSFRLELGEEPVYIHARHPGLRFLPSPIVGLAQDLSGSKIGFHFTVVNTSQQPWKGSVALAQPSGWKAILDAQDFSLAPGQRIVIKGDCDIPAGTKKGTYALDASMKLPDGTPFEFPVSLDVHPSVTIANVGSAFAWDQASSWEHVQPLLKIDQTEQVVAGRPPLLASLQEEKYWKGPEELSAEVRLASSPDALLVYAQVLDANMKVPQTWPGVAGSCVELFVDGRAPQAGLGHSNYGPGVWQLLIKPPQGAQQSLQVWNASEKSGKLDGVTAIGSRSGDQKYWMAIQIPWKALSGARTKDQPFGFDLGVDGPTKDGSGRKSQLMLFGTGANNADASNFGIVRTAIDTANLGAR